MLNRPIAVLRSDGGFWAVRGLGMDKTVRSEPLSSGLADQAGEVVLRAGQGHVSLTEKTSFAKHLGENSHSQVET